MPRTTEQIKTEANEFQSILDNAPTNIDNGDLLVEYLGGLNYVISRTGLMMAEVQKLYDIAYNKVFTDSFKQIKELSATMAKKFVESAIADEDALIVWVTQLNKTAKHQADNLRTQISYAKESLRMTKTGY